MDLILAGEATGTALRPVPDSKLDQACDRVLVQGKGDGHGYLEGIRADIFWNRRKRRCTSDQFFYFNIQCLRSRTSSDLVALQAAIPIQSE